jgi:general secretion pathway protein D
MTLRPARLWLALGFLAAGPGLFAQFPSPATARSNPIPRPAAPAASNGPAAKPVMTMVKGADDDTVDSFSLSDGDIDSVLNRLEFFTGRTIVRPGQLPTATYSLKITRPISKQEIVVALETLLTLNGVSVTPMGERFLKVTALAQAKSEAPEMILGSSLKLPPSGRIVTKLFELNFLRTSEFVPQITSFMSPGVGGGIVQLEKANVMMVTDTLENIQRVERLLAEVDMPRQGGLTPKFYVLKNGAKAADVVTKLHTMLSGPAGTQLRSTTTFTADDRTNQIILIADAREYPLFDTLINQLDIKADPYTRMEVIPLQHGDSKDVATLLSALISGQNAATQKAAAQSVRPGQVVTTPVNPATPAATPAAVAAEAVASSEFSTFITIQPDARTNSIVVSGTPDDIRLIKGIVGKIDVLLAQVAIQVVIAEVTLTDSDNSGLSALNLTVGPTAGTTNGSTSITNFAGSIAGWNVTSGVVNPLSFAAAISSAGDKHKVKILQADTITTTHNKQATLTVSTQEPVITGATSEPIAATATQSFATSSQVTYKDIGITLKVTPLIGDDGGIQLQIDQTVDDDQGQTTIDGNSQPIIGHREANSYVNVQDGQMVVLGGLQSAGRTADKEKLGLLYQIPVLSDLLGYRTNTINRTELLLFIRPHVIRQDEATNDVRNQINGMSNKDQVNDYLKDPNRMPNPKETLKDKLD